MLKYGILHGSRAEGILLGADVARPFISGAEWAAAFAVEVKHRSIRNSGGWLSVMRYDLGFPLALVCRSEKYRWATKNGTTILSTLSEREWFERFSTLYHTVVPQYASVLHGHAGLIILSQHPDNSYQNFILELREWSWIISAILRSNIAIFAPHEAIYRSNRLLIAEKGVARMLETYIKEGDVRDKKALKDVCQEIYEYMNPTNLVIVNPILEEYGYHIDRRSMYNVIRREVTFMKRQIEKKTKEQTEG